MLSNIYKTKNLNIHLSLSGFTFAVFC